MGLSDGLGGYKAYVKALCKKLLIPYLLYSFLYFLFNAAKVILLHKEINLLHNFLGILIQLRGTDFTVGVWFLPLLFLSEVVVYPLVLCRKRIQVPAFILLLTIGFIYANQVHQVLPWGLDAVPLSSFFIWMGYQYKGMSLEWFRQKTKVVSILFCLGLLWANIVIGMWNDYRIGDSVDMNSMTYGNPILYVVAAVAGIGFTIILCRDLLDSFEIKPMKCIGQNTLHIYCIHGLVITFIREIREKLIGFGTFTTIVEQLLVSLLVMSICIGLIYCGRVLKSKMARVRNTQ